MHTALSRYGQSIRSKLTLGISFDYSDIMRGRQEAPAEANYYGIPVGPRNLFVPRRITRQHAKQIDTITVTWGDNEATGQFVGAYQDIAAFLVSVDADLDAMPFAMSDESGLPRFAPLVSVLVEHRFGEAFLKTNYTRRTASNRGYKDILQPLLMGHQKEGSYYIDAQDTLRAVYVEQRKDDEAKEVPNLALFNDLDEVVITWVINAWFRAKQKAIEVPKKS